MTLEDVWRILHIPIIRELVTYDRVKGGGDIAMDLLLSRARGI